MSQGAEAEDPRDLILKLLATKGPLSLSDIKAETALSTGSIYYHLSRVRDYVTQDKGRRYMLSEKGRQFLASRAGTSVLSGMPYSFFDSVLTVFSLAPIVRFLTDTPKTAILSTLAIVQLGAFLYRSGNLNQLLLMILRPRIFDPIFSFLFSWLVTFAVLEVMLLLTSGRHLGNEFELASGLSISFLPLIFYALLSRIGLSETVFLLPVLQFWSVVILWFSIRLTVGISMLSSFLISLAVMLTSLVVFESVFMASTLFGQLSVVVQISLVILSLLLARFDYARSSV